MKIKQKQLEFKNFAEDELPHELLLTTRQKTKLRNSFNNNMSTDLKSNKKILGSGNTALIISNEEMNDIIKIV